MAKKNKKQPPVKEAQDGMYWASTTTGNVVLAKRKGSKATGFGNMAAAVASWGAMLAIPEHGWNSAAPDEEGWYAARWKNGEKVLRVAKGVRLHCYDFDSDDEVDVSSVLAWNGPLLPEKSRGRKKKK